MNRKEQLKSWHFGKLQSTEEFKHYCDTYLNMYLMNEEVEYILKASIEDLEAPFSYDDFEHFYYDEDELRTALLDDLTDNDVLIQFMEYFGDTKEELNKRFNKLDLNDLKDTIERDINHLTSFDIEEYEHQTEVMQWFFICDDRLLSQLEKKGEVILNNKFWGRQGFGQSITMDGVMIDIFKEWYLNLYGLPFDLNKKVEE